MDIPFHFKPLKMKLAVSTSQDPIILIVFDDLIDSSLLENISIFDTNYTAGGARSFDIP
jgi:hypothetical protein